MEQKLSFCINTAVNEINHVGWQLTHEVWTNPKRAYKDYNKFNFFN